MSISIGITVKLDVAIIQRTFILLHELVWSHLILPILWNLDVIITFSVNKKFGETIFRSLLQFLFFASEWILLEIVVFFKLTGFNSLVKYFIIPFFFDDLYPLLSLPKHFDFGLFSHKSVCSPAFPIVV